MTKLTIDRKEWLRGEGSDASSLLRKSDGKKCCLGFHALQLGYTEEQIGSLASPPNLVFRTREDRYNADGAPHSILVYRDSHVFRSGPTPLCARLMMVNDEPDRPDAEREAELTTLFAEADIEVEFVG